MRKLIHKVVLSLLIVVMALPVCACDLHLNESDVKEYVAELEPILNGDYTVLDVREVLGGNNVRAHYQVVVVMEDEQGTRYYYEYYANDYKNAEYLTVAKLAPKDKVKYQDGTLFLIED